MEIPMEVVNVLRPFLTGSLKNKDKMIERAVMLNSLKSLVYLKSCGCNISKSIYDSTGQSPISIAALEGKIDIVKWFLKEGVDPFSNQDDWETFFSSCIAGGNMSMVKLGYTNYKKGKRKIFIGDTIKSILHIGNLDLLKYFHEELNLVVKYAKYEWNDNPDNHPLFMAAKHKTLLDYLVKNCNFDINTKLDGHTIITYISEIETFDYLYNSEYDFKRNRIELLSMLIRICQPLTLLDYLCDTYVRLELLKADSTTKSLIHIAVSFDEFKIVSHFAQQSDLAFDWNNKENPLFYSANSYEMVVFLEEETKSSIVELWVAKGAEIYELLSCSVSDVFSREKRRMAWYYWQILSNSPFEDESTKNYLMNFPDD
jgi:ankyrin repeat protein